MFTYFLFLLSDILFAPFTPFTIALSAILCTISYDDHKSAAIEELQALGVVIHTIFFAFVWKCFY